MSRTILCLSRSYLSRLLPELGKRDTGARYLHMVQTDREAAYIRAQGGEVVLNIQEVVRSALSGRDAPIWEEPADFRELTGFPWSPIHSDRYLPAFSGRQRLIIAGALFHALERLFTTQRIDGFLSEPVALFITHACFYLCRRHGARSLMWANSYFPDHFHFVDAIEISQPARRSGVDEDEAARISVIAREYMQGVAEDRRGPAYHPSFLAKKLSAFSFFKQRRGEEPLVLKPGIGSIVTQLGRLGRAVAARCVFPRGSDFMTAGSVGEHLAYLRALSTGSGIYDGMPAAYDAANLMFPLQYEPEASLLYFAPEFRDQPHFVETVLRALPDSHVLWVKEHPNQFGALGAKIWRRLKKRYGNLRFVHGRQSGRQLIRHCGLVVSISSSAGMDALVLGRRVIVAGKVFYRGMTGSLPVDSPAGIAACLNDPSVYGPVDNFAANLREMAELGRACYPGDPQPAHALYTETNLAMLVKAIRAETADLMTVKGGIEP